MKLKITPVHSYAEIYGALTSGRAHLAAAALKVPAKSIAGVTFGPVYQRVREHLVYRRGALRPASLAQIGNGPASCIEPALPHGTHTAHDRA